MKTARFLSAVLICLIARFAFADAKQYLKKHEDWYKSAQGQKIVANVLSWQSPLGGWPKNTDTTAEPYKGDPKDLKPTFDNGATTDELRLLAHAFGATKDEKCRAAVLKGIDYVLEAQYPTGGWPQFFPPGRKYHRHITFNDNAMVRLMEFLRQTWTDKAFSFIDEPRKDKARKAFEAGIACIVKCQIKVNGTLTAWCAQHDEKDYSPRPGRAYELASISGAESVGIVRLLMSLDKPGPEVVQSIESAVAWFEHAKLKGIRVDTREDAKSPTGKDKVLVEDPAASPLWARFYDISTGRPIYCDRDGLAKAKLSDIGYERRNGYAWLGTWPQALLEKDYPAWKAKQARQ